MLKRNNIYLISIRIVRKQGFLYSINVTITFPTLKPIENIIREGISKNLGQINILHKKILINSDRKSSSLYMSRSSYGKNFKILKIWVDIIIE